MYEVFALGIHDTIRLGAKNDHRRIVILNHITVCRLSVSK